MAMNRERITIVGCGPGARECVTPQALDAVLRSDVLVGAQRLLNLFPEATGQRIAARGNIEEVSAAIDANPDRRVAVLVTGDPGISSLAKPVLQRFGLALCRVIPGISSVQVAFARLGLDWTGARILSAHAGPPRIDAVNLANEYAIAVLAGSPRSAQWIAGLLDRLGAGWTMYLAENLTLANERIREIAPEELPQAACGALSILVLLRSEHP